MLDQNTHPQCSVNKADDKQTWSRLSKHKISYHLDGLGLRIFLEEADSNLEGKRV